MAEVLTKLGPYWFNASRADGSRFVTSPVPVQIQLTDEKAIQRFCGGEDRAGLVRCEAVGFNGDFLQEYQVLPTGKGQLLDIPAIRLDSVEFDNKANVVTVGVTRMLPLSSSHCGQPIRLAFVVCDSIVAFSGPFVVCAKQTKAGAKQKHSKSKPQLSDPPHRELKRAVIATAVAMIEPAWLAPTGADVNPSEPPSADHSDPIKKRTSGLSPGLPLARSNAASGAATSEQLTEHAVTCPGTPDQQASESDCEAFFRPPSAAEAQPVHMSAPTLYETPDVGMPAVPVASASRVDKSLEASARFSDPFSGLDSSAKEIQIQITDKEALDAILAASTRPDGVQLTCEVVGFLGQFLTHFTDGFLVDIPAVEIMKKTLDPSTGTITVSVKRTLPLSSSHGGQPLRLAFHIVPRIVVVTEPFVVLAKQGKTGSVKKILKSRPQPPLSTERLVARAELSAAMPALLPAPVWPRQPGGGRGNGMNGFVASKVESKAPATPTITMELRPTRPPSYAKTLTGPSHKRQRDPDSSYASDASPTDSRIPLPPPPVGLESMVSFGSLPSPSLLGTAFSPFLPAPGGQMTHLDSLQYEMTPTLALLVQAAVANADSEHMGGSGDLVQE